MSGGGMFPDPSSSRDTDASVSPFGTSTTCHVCDKIFASPGVLSKHLQVHSKEKPYTCHVCGKSFGRKGVLKRHLVTHSNEKPYHCDLCGKGFTQKGSVVKHMVVHTGEKPYQCHKCFKNFTEKSNLLKHLRVVHKDKERYRCSKCHMTFAFKSQLTTHTNDAHVRDQRVLSSVRPFERLATSSESSPKPRELRNISIPKITAVGIPLTYPSEQSDNAQNLSAIRRAVQTLFRGNRGSKLEEKGDRYFRISSQRSAPLVLYRGDDTTD